MLRHDDKLPPRSLYPSLLHVFIINITLEFPFKRKRMYRVRCFKSDHACVEFIIRPDLCGKNGSADMIHTHGKTCISLTVLIHVVAWHETCKFQNLNEKPITLILMAVRIWTWSHFFLKGSANILKYQSHNWQLSFSFQEKKID